MDQKASLSHSLSRALTSLTQLEGQELGSEYVWRLEHCTAIAQHLLDEGTPRARLGHNMFKNRA